MTTPTSLLSDKFVDMAFITQLTGLTDKWFYSRWLESEVETWLQQRIAQSRQ